MPAWHSRPILFPDLQVVWDAFHTLRARRTYRHVSNGERMIPIAEPFPLLDMTLLADLFGIEQADDREEFVTYLIHLDFVDRDILWSQKLQR